MKKWILAFVMFLGACSNMNTAGLSPEDSIRKIKERESETAKPTPTPMPISVGSDHPAVTPATEQQDSVHVEFVRSTWDAKESAVFRGVNQNGTVLWTYETDWYGISELQRINEIGIYKNFYYFDEGGKIVKLNLQTGAIIWENMEFGGCASGSDFAEDGTLYVCGYYGPDLYAISPDGDTLMRLEQYDENHWWASGIEYHGDHVLISYYGGNENPVAVNLPLNDEMIQVSYVDATSYLPEPQYNIYHTPGNVCDGDLTTAWVEAGEGQGYGETLTIYLAHKAKITGFAISNGYQASQHVFDVNSRVKKLKVSIDGNPGITISLLDSQEIQSFNLDSPVEAESISFTIMDVYPGTKYEDTCISEITLY